MGSIWEKLRSAAVKATSDGPVSNSLLTLSNTVPQFTNAVRAHDTLKDDDKIRRIIKYIRKLAVDSAVDESLKGVAGGILVDKIVKEGPKDQSSLDTKINQNNKFGLEVADVVRARIENMHEEANCNEQQMTISTQSIRLLDCFEDLPKEPIKGSNSSNTAPKRIMIRSRL